MPRTAAALILVLALLMGGASPVLSSPSARQAELPVEVVECPPGGLWYASPDGQPRLAPQCPPGAVPDDTPPASPQSVNATGGPDDYGYTWDNSLPLNWVDAVADGTVIAFPAGYTEGTYSSPIALPFTFKLYENAYTNLNVAASGYVGFTDGFNWPGQGLLLNAAPPNNVIAPYWSPFFLNDSGTSARVFYKSGGVAPDRYFVVEWYQVLGGFSPGTEQYTFEVILRENGDIEFHYLTMDYTGGYYCGIAGIEDSTGLTGLVSTNFCAGVPGASAVLFERPAPAARVRISPHAQGQFTAPGETRLLPFVVTNTGELGSDTYNLHAVGQGWPATVLAEDGLTPVADTDLDTWPDTGPLAEGESISLMLAIEAPAAAGVGDNNTFFLAAVSTLNPSVSRTATLMAAVPAPFAQVFADSADGAVSLALVQPSGEALIEAGPDGTFSYNPAVTDTPTGFAAVWPNWRSLGNVSVEELEYALLDQSGALLFGPTKLTDHSSATLYTYDSAAIAAAPNGRLGVAWVRYLYDEGLGQFNYNVYFQVLAATGASLFGPVNLTNNNAWGNSSSLNVPQLFDLSLVSTDDSRFVLAWHQRHVAAAGSVDDIYYAVRDHAGAQVTAPVKFTADTPGSGDAFSGPALARLSGNRFLLSLARGGNVSDIYYAVLDSAGSVALKPLTNLTNDGTTQFDWSPDVAQLGGGQIVLAWTSSAGQSRIRTAVLDANYNVVSAPTLLTNAAALTGDAEVSVAPALGGDAVLTWMDADGNSRRSLYYALLAPTGAVLTPPMRFRSSLAYLLTSVQGYGNAAYRLLPWHVYVPNLVRTAGGGSLAAPAVLGPAGATPRARVVLDWSDVAGATGYRVQMSPSNGFGTLVLDQIVTASTLTWASNLTGPHYWRVQALGAAGAGPFSAVGTLQLVNYNADDDGDSLRNGWELHGYDADNNGTVEINLPALGASYRHKDLFVEMDYMVKGSVSNGLGPDTTVLNGIVAAYQAMPAANPDGVPGIKIHLHLDDQVPYDPDLNPVYNEFYALKNAYFTPNRVAVYHYMLWADAYSGGSSSGLSFTIPASDFIVTVGSLWHGGAGGTDEEKIGTFVHELGHNLGLFHGGNDHINYKPNYLSVMNYRHQFWGVYHNGSWYNFEYQSFSLPSLNEASLNETVGLNGGGVLASYGTIHTCPGPTFEWWYTWNASGSADWNCNGSANESGVIADINGDGFISTLGSQNNIASLVFHGGGVIGSGQSPEALANLILSRPLTVMEPELDYEQMLKLRATLSPPLPTPAP